MLRLTILWNCPFFKRTQTQNATRPRSPFLPCERKAIKGLKLRRLWVLWNSRNRNRNTIIRVIFYPAKLRSGTPTRLLVSSKRSNAYYFFNKRKTIQTNIVHSPFQRFAAICWLQLFLLREGLPYRPFIITHCLLYSLSALHPFDMFFGISLFVYSRYLAVVW